MTNQITQVNVFQQVAPTPNTLQRFGAVISQGATNTTQFTSSMITQPSDLTPLLNGTKSLSTLTFSTGTVTATTTTPHGFTIGDSLYLTITGATPVGYNGIFLCTITGASTFTYTLVSNPGTMTLPGVYTEEDVAELVEFVTTYYAQGYQTAFWILELGPGNPNDGVAALTTYLTANPNQNYTPGALGYYYVYAVPRTWDANTNFLALIASYENLTARTYFMVTTTLATYQFYTVLMKDVRAIIESPARGVYPANVLTAATYTAAAGGPPGGFSPNAVGYVTFTTTSAHQVAVGQWFQVNGMTPTGYNGWFLAEPGTTGSTLIGAVYSSLAVETALGTLVASYYANTGINPGTAPTEMDAAAMFYKIINQAPSATNKVTPFAFDFWYGVTPFPSQGNGALLSTLQAANITIVGTGAEGGISNTIDLWGRTLDGNDFSYWYATDWLAVNCDLNVTNAIINGSNNPINPLYYNQAGINSLEGIIAQTVENGVTFGMILGTPIQLSLDGPMLNNNTDAGLYTGYSIVNAVPFIQYSIENPGDYKIGRYAGFSVIFTPARGFENVIINMTVSSFVVA